MPASNNVSSSPTRMSRLTMIHPWRASSAHKWRIEPVLHIVNVECGDDLPLWIFFGWLGVSGVGLSCHKNPNKNRKRRSIAALQIKNVPSEPTLGVADIFEPPAQVTG